MSTKNENDTITGLDLDKEKLLNQQKREHQGDATEDGDELNGRFFRIGGFVDFGDEIGAGDVDKPAGDDGNYKGVNPSILAPRSNGDDCP